MEMFSKKNPKLEIVVGSQSKIHGEITSSGTVRIDGTIEGNLFADCVIVGETGVVTGDITARTFIAGGKLTGNVRAGECVEIQATGAVYGDIQTPRLVVAEGGQLEGRSFMQKSPELEYKPAIV